MQFIDLKSQQDRIRSQLEAAMRKVLDHGQYIMGPEVAELEEALAAYVGVRHCIAVASGTDALLIAMMALGIGPGDEVITTPFTFIATGEMIALLGAKPVFVDIDPRTCNLDPELIEAAITPRTRAILPVSLYGQCADFDAINAIVEKHNRAFSSVQANGSPLSNQRSTIHNQQIVVIEDAAQSFGAIYRGRYSCALSTVGCTSFFPSKPLGGYGDGGACFTDDEELATRMRQIRVHGQDRRYNHPLIGINGRLDTLQAAVLLVKLSIFPEEVEARQRIGTRYTELLGKAVETPFVGPEATSVYAQYTIQVEDRGQVQERLNAAGIPTAVHYPVPLHLQPAFAGLGLGAGSFPRAERAAQRVLSLPMHPYLANTDQDRIAESVCRCLSL